MVDGSPELVLTDLHGTEDMNKLVLTAITVMASGMCTAGSLAQGQWAFGDSSVTNRGERIHLAADGDLLVSGLDEITRINGATSTLEWRVRVDGFFPEDIIEASDGRVVVTGIRADSNGATQVVLMFFDPLGNLIDSRVHPGRNGFERHELIETLDQGFLIAGEVLADNGNIRPMVIKTDPVGGLLWCKRYDMPDFPGGIGEFCDVEEQKLDDGRSVFHLTGRFKPDSLQKDDTLMVSIDEFGSPINAAFLGFQGFSDSGRGLWMLSDGFLVTGYSKEIGEGGGTYLMRLDSSFNVQWYRALEKFTGTKAMDVTLDGMVRLPGTSSFPDPIRGAVIVEMPLAAPNAASGMRYGGVVSDDGLEFVQEGSGYAMIGFTRSYGTPLDDAYLVRTDGLLSSGCEEASYDVAVTAHAIDRRTIQLETVDLEPPQQEGREASFIQWFEIAICEDPDGPCTDPPIEMIGWWTMDEPSGIIAVDSMSGLDGVHVGGPQIVTGKVENALDFDGVGDHVRIAPDPLLGLDFAGLPTGDLSVDAWIRIDSQGTMEWGPIAAANGSCTGWAFYVRNDRLEAAFSDGPLQARWTTSTPIPHGQWVHVAFACDRGVPAETCRFYVDGVEEFGVNAFFTPTTGSTPGFHMDIGRMNQFCAAGNSQAKFFDGGIDEVEYFRRAIDASEVQAIHAAGEAGKCKVGCDPPWDQPFCLDDAFIDVTIPLCNASPVDADVQMTFTGINPPDCGSIPGPTGFTVLTPNPVLVPGGQCVNVVVRIDRPAGMTALNQVGCYQVELENLVDGRISSCMGSVQDRRDLCPLSPPDPIQIAVGVLAEIDIPFINTGFEGPILEWRAVAYGPDMLFSDAFSLDGGEPGTSATGELRSSPGSKGTIALDLRANRYVSGSSDLVLFTRDSRGWNPLTSLAIRMEPGIFECFGDLNGDFRVDGGDLGMILGDWGECGGCPTDLDGNGRVDGSDLGLFLSAWGECDGNV